VAFFSPRPKLTADRFVNRLLSGDEALQMKAVGHLCADAWIIPEAANTALNFPSGSPRRARPLLPLHIPCAGIRARRHRLIGEAAEHEPQRRLLLFDGGDDRFGSAHGIALLLAADRLGEVAARDRRRGVGVDWAFRDFQRTAGPVGAERAGLDDNDLDPERPDLLGKRFRHAFDSKLARRVVARAGKADEAAHRRYVDDRARLLRPHDRQDGASQRREAKHIGLEHRPNVGVVALLDRREIAVAGVVDEDVDPAEPGHGRLDRGVDLILSVHVERKREAILRLAGDNVLDFGLVTRGGDNAIAALEEDDRQLPAKSGRTAGDEPDRFLVCRAFRHGGLEGSLVVGERAAFSHDAVGGGNALDPVRSVPPRVGRPQGWMAST
jgi:hypothetical protein